jgi:hypothetical protein
MVPYPATGKANLKRVPNTSEISVKPNSAKAYSHMANKTIVPEAKTKIVNVGSSPTGIKLFIVNGGKNEYTGSRGVFFWTCVAGRLIKSLKEITSLFFALSK